MNRHRDNKNELSSHNGNGNQTAARLQDVADRCGMSKSTVSRALRDDRTNIAQATIDRIRQTAKEVGYDPDRNYAARRLAADRLGRPMLSHAIGLFFFHPGLGQSNYFHQIFRGVLDAVIGTDFQVLTTDLSSLESKSSIPTLYRRGDVDGALTITTAHNWQRNLEHLRDEPNFGNRPVVGLVEQIATCSSVCPDYYSVGFTSASHLIDLGHRRIGISVRGLPHSNDYISLMHRGYREACVQYGLDPDHCLFQCDWDPSKEEENVTALLNALDQNPPVTGFMALHDQHAVWIYQRLTAAGYRVPEDVSVIGKDDTEAIVKDSDLNILTTIRLPLYDVGNQGTKLLIRRITEEEKEDRDIVLPVELVERKSTAPPAKNRPRV